MFDLHFYVRTTCLMKNPNIPSAVDAGSFEHTLSTQVAGDVGRDDAVSVSPLHEKARPLLITSLFLPSPRASPDAEERP